MKNTIPSPNDAIGKSLREHFKKKDAFFEEILRTHATPPIKGEITPGKIKWRGIQIRVQVQGTRITEWLEQRGKQIGGVFYE